MTQKIQSYLIRLGAEIAIPGHVVKCLKARQKHKLLLDYLYIYRLFNYFEYKYKNEFLYLKSSKNIQKKDGGPDRSVSD